MDKKSSGRYFKTYMVAPDIPDELSIIWKPAGEPLKKMARLYYYCKVCGKHHFVLRSAQLKAADQYEHLIRKKVGLEGEDVGDPDSLIDDHPDVSRHCFKIRVSGAGCPSKLRKEPYVRGDDVEIVNDFERVLKLGEKEVRIPSAVRTLRRRGEDADDNEELFQPFVTAQTFTYCSVDDLTRDGALDCADHQAEIDRLRRDGDRREREAGRRVCQTYGPDDSVQCGYNVGLPCSVETNAIWKAETWTQCMVESDAGRALLDTRREVAELTKKLKEVGARQEELIKREVMRTPVLPRNMANVWAMAARTSGNVRYADVEPNRASAKTLCARFIRYPRLMSTSGADRMVAERALAFFHLLPLGSSDPVPCVIDHACVKSLAPPNIVRHLQDVCAAVGPPRASRPPGNRNPTHPHTRTFWTEHAKQELDGIYYFNFEFHTLSGGLKVQTISLNCAPYFPFQCIVLGLDFLRHYPCAYIVHPRLELRFQAIDTKEELVIEDFLFVRVTETYQLDSNKKVLMGEEAKRVLFYDSGPLHYDDIGFDFETEKIGTIQPLEEVIQRRPNVPQRPRTARQRRD